MFVLRTQELQEEISEEEQSCLRVSLKREQLLQNETLLNEAISISTVFKFLLIN